MNRIITLSLKEMELLQKAITEGAKGFEHSDKFFNIHPRSVKVTNKHTGDEFQICVLQKREIKKMLK